LRNSELNVRQSEKLRIADERRKIGCLRRKSGDWLRKRRFGNERRRQSGGGRRRKNKGGGLRRLRRSTRSKKS
jgi:hypothetical protein